MEQLTKNQAVATSQEAVQNQNEPQLRDENAHNDKSVHGVLNPTYQAGLRRDAVQPDIEAELKLVKDFLKVRCRLALLPFLISCLIWLDLVASLPLIKERILVIILLLHFLSLMLGSVLVLMLPLLVWL